MSCVVCKIVIASGVFRIEAVWAAQELRSPAARMREKLFPTLLMLTFISVYRGLSGTNATSVTLFSSSTKSTTASPLDNVPSLC